MTFQRIAKLRDVSGRLLLVFGSEADDPTPVVLTLMPSYVALATGKVLPVGFDKIEEYADCHAADLCAVALHERKKWRASIVLE
jgi:hypothetical protein